MEQIAEGIPFLKITLYIGQDSYAICKPASQSKKERGAMFMLSCTKFHSLSALDLYLLRFMVLWRLFVSAILDCRRTPSDYMKA